MWIVAPLLCGLIFGAGLLDFRHGAADQGSGLPGYLRRVGSEPRGGDGRGAGCGSARLQAGRSRVRGRWFAAQNISGRAKSGIDLPLVAGAALFGIGWGLVGLCPGPALESLATLSPGIIVFVVAMAAGMIAHDAWQQSRLTAQRDRMLASATDG